MTSRLKAVNIGPHSFADGVLLCSRCKATRAAAELDAQGVPTRFGLPYSRYPQCLAASPRSRLVCRVPGAVLRAIRLGL